MLSELVIWSLLIAIGVSDAQKHRIPNKAVLLLLVAVTANVLYSPSVSLWIMRMVDWLRLQCALYSTSLKQWLRRR